MNIPRMRVAIFAALVCSISAHAQQFDVIIRGGVIYDGSGGAPVVGDLAIRGDRIQRIGRLGKARARLEINAAGRAVAPGFINMMSGGGAALIQDGRAESDIRQGVTLEISGEGESMGPLTQELREYKEAREGDIKYAVDWNTLAEGLERLAQRGVSCNVASFVGAATIRENVLGFANRAPTAPELERMRGLTRLAMQEGALGVGSALIYAPGGYAKTDELIALAEEAGKYGGIYISHMRSEADQLLEAVDELIAIARAAHVPAEIYHLKAAGRRNWSKLDDVIKKVEAARASVSASLPICTPTRPLRRD